MEEQVKGQVLRLKSNQVVVVIVPFPAQGHLNQLLHLACLLDSRGLPVHYVGSTIHNRQVKARFHGWQLHESSLQIHFHDFELGPYDSAPPSSDMSIHFPAHIHPLLEVVTKLREPVSQVLNQLSSNFRKVIIIHDTLMASIVQDFKKFQNVESYNFIPISAFAMFFNIWQSMLRKPFELNSNEISISLQLVPSNEGCYTQEFENFMFNQQMFWGLESGRLYNTSRVIEGNYLELLDQLSKNKGKKNFAIGPFHPTFKNDIAIEKSRHACVEWLDKQEKSSSVIYVCFGSSITMTNEQIKELAVGLEKSNEKFIWVLRNADTTDIFKDGEVKTPILPEGFEDRVKNKGMVVRDWVPQLTILSHPSIGGFMNHCGWNSCLESMSLGVPIAAWPMHCDQPKNAILVTKVLKIGTMVRDWDQRAELVMADTIDDAIRRLMGCKEGHDMRERATKLGVAIRASVGKDDKSCLEIDSFIAHITK